MFKNLPFRVREYEDSMIINELIVMDQFKATINNRTIRHAIGEMYTSTKMEVMNYVSKSTANGVGMVSVVADFWTCSPQAAKYLSVGVFFGEHN